MIRPGTVPGLLALPPGDHPALWQATGTVSYAQLGARVAGLRYQVRRAGAGPGAVVAVAAGTGAAALWRLLGAMAAGVAAPLAPDEPPARTAEWLARLQPAALLCDPADTGLAALAGAAGIPVVTDPGADPPAPPDGRWPGPGDTALLLRTTGTTGVSKLVPLTHHNLVTAARAESRSLRLTGADRTLLVMPPHHAHGLMAVLATLASAGTVCLAPLRETALRVAVRDGRPTWYTAAPAVHHTLLHAAPAFTGHTLRFVRSVSAPLPVALLARVERAFGVPLVEAYAMSEAPGVVTSNPVPPGERRPGTVGRPVDGARVAVLRPDGSVAPAGTGEVLVAGEHVTAGYWRGAGPPDRSPFHHGWLRTGDLGTLDPDGYLTITGRSSEFINRGGEKVAPQEVDEALLAHPDVLDAASYPVEHPTLGQDVAAAVVLRPGGSTGVAQLRDFLRTRLAAAKCPRDLTVVPAIPRTGSGKVVRRSLADAVAEMVGPVDPAGRPEPRV